MGIKSEGRLNEEVALFAIFYGTLLKYYLSKKNLVNIQIVQ